MIEIFTDGSCCGNPGPGGYGVVVYKDGTIIDAYQERHDETTNNRMELGAVLWAMEIYGNPENFDGGPPVVYSDSTYVVNSFTVWIHNWKINGWKDAKKKPIKNRDLIQQYDKFLDKGYRIWLRKIEGHAGVEGNELADKLATGKIKVEDILNGESDV